ncbi:IPT/TIG domain-containing protein [Actinomadura sp. WMMA1423]|uniref:IPT/TIG domain-containing protein n=1 Tax=Actinomadura sp. WMMA1423 TaxID=2591108 RepID=UPI00143CDB48|nr:IPT/TIG domain-containing protein [Actinomadura sp. WMMA1423]
MTDTEVQCIVPGGCGVAPVTAVLDTVVTSTPRNFYYIASPVLFDIEPAEGEALAPSPISFNGNFLLTTNQVLFNGIPSTAPPVVVNDNQVLATPVSIDPVGGSPWSQPVVVGVRTAGGSTSLFNGFYLAYDRPAVSAISPTSGPAGVEVIVTGTAFVSNSINVTFDSHVAEFSPVSDTQLVALSPTGVTGTVDLVVHTPGGASEPVPFTFT